jgi:cytidine deaminase
MPITKNISFSYREYEGSEELEKEDQELIIAAKESAKMAYAPYSMFMVGAALRLESGRIVHGSNVENAAFPSGICAERTAIAGAVSNFPHDKPVAIAIAAMNGDGFTVEPVSPCGNCRQVIAEEEAKSGKQIRIILTGTTRIRVIKSIGHLLPLQFSGKSLRADHP